MLIWIKINSLGVIEIAKGESINDIDNDMSYAQIRKLFGKTFYAELCKVTTNELTPAGFKMMQDLGWKVYGEDISVIGAYGIISREAKDKSSYATCCFEKRDNVEVFKCPCCGASMKKHWHRLSAGLANTLIKFRAEVIKRGLNKIHVPKEIALNKTEYNNFQKLRYHALVAKVRKEDGSHESGYWLLTKRGNQFCKGLVSIPANVQTFRNKISDKAEEMVTIFDVLNMKDGDIPYWDSKYEFAYELAEVEDIPYADGFKADKDGNGLLF